MEKVVELLCINVLQARYVFEVTELRLSCEGVPLDLLGRSLVQSIEDLFVPCSILID